MPVTLDRLRWALRQSTRHRAANDLREVNRRLDELARSTEQDFLVVGASLQKILDGVGEQATTLMSLSASVCGTENEVLEEVLGQASNWATQAGLAATAGEAILKLLPSARAARLPLRDLENSIRTFRVMGVVTRVETARLGSKAAGYEPLIDELQELAESVQNRCESVEGAMNGLCALLEHAGNTVAAAERVQQARLLKLIDESTGGVRDLHSEQERVAVVAAQAREGYEDVTKGVREITTALQFHDSTRQRFDHVREALELVATELQSGRGTSADVAAASLQLQARQLEQARDSFLQSVLQVKSDLGLLEARATGFAESAVELMGRNREAPGKAPEGLQQRCLAVADAVSEWLGSRRALTETAVQARRACEQIGEYAREIETLGVRLLWLSLNGQVQAVRLESDAQVMESVADCIRLVSQQASEGALQLHTSLREVANGVDAMASSLGHSGEDEAQQALALRTALNDEAVRIGTSVEKRAALLRSIESGGAALAADISSLLSTITADLVMERGSAWCLETLRDVVPEAGHLRQGHSTADLISSERKYTMMAEREVHEAFAGASGASTESVAEAGSSEFGENVEMF